jgi:GGDEF domain-containing protein
MYEQRIDGDAWVEEVRTVDQQPPATCYLVLGRLGGDEFVLTGPFETHEEAHQHLVRLRLWAVARMTG